MVYIIGLLTAAIVVDCILLILLVIVQLPKKEAGAGMAFGGGTADALFGAGSGTVLSKITKYAIGIMFGLALLIAVLQKPSTSKDFLNAIQHPVAAPVHSAPPAETAPQPIAVPAAANTNALLLTVPTSNSPVVPTAQ